MNDEKPIKWVFRFLERVCPGYLLEEIEGDLIQCYKKDVRKFNKRKAGRRLVWNTIRFLRPGIVLRNKFSWELNQWNMLRSYFILACRGLTKHKVFSGINVLGLSVGITSFMLILQFVRFELSYDNFHKHADNIYRVATEVRLQNEVVNHEPSTYEGIVHALTNDFPEVKAVTSISGFGPDRTFVRYANKENEFVPFDDYKGYYVDSSFLKVFSFPLQEGDPEVVLHNPFTAVISEEFASSYFNGDPVGKTLEIKNEDAVAEKFTVTGVFKNIPENSHFRFDILVHPPGNEVNFYNGKVGFWDWAGHTYILLEPDEDPSSMENKLGKLALANNSLKVHKDDYGQVSRFELQPLRDIHLFSHLDFELENNGSGIVVYSLLFLAIVVLVIAWVNYINLSTAISAEKIKEIGVRKIIGASRAGLCLQVLTESALFNALAIGIGLLLMVLLMPSFSQMVDIPVVSISSINGSAAIYVLIFFIVSTSVAGSYPAYMISSFYPINSLKGKGGKGNFIFRKGLVVFQFTSALMLMILCIVVYHQISFMRNKELGINIDHVLVVNARNFDMEVWSNEAGGYVVDSAYLYKTNQFKEALRGHSSIKEVASLSHLPGQLPNWGSEFKATGKDPNKAFRLSAIGVDYGFLNTFGVKLLAGRNFSPEFSTDQGNEGKRAVVINEAAASLLGFSSPDEAVNQHISTYWGADYQIIGVVNSFHQRSLRENLEPIYFILNPRALSYYALHLNSKDASNTLDVVKTTWKKYFSDQAFSYFFLDDFFNRQYHHDQKFSKVLVIFTGLAIFIGCMGLFGLTSYSIVQRTKEIGIRKVLGATAFNIIRLFSIDFLRLLVLSMLVTVPVMVVVTNRWLENYAYRISPGWWMFIFPFLVVAAIALLIISTQTSATALRNPVDHLKHE